MKERKNEIAVCKNCGKLFHPRYSSNGKFCSRTCSADFRAKEQYNNYIKHQEEYQGVRNIKFIKRHLLKEQDYNCSICGMPNTWNGKELVFILDHIDGNAANNYRSNLRLICPNCDSQLETYKSKNKNSAREYHRLNHR